MQFYNIYKGEALGVRGFMHFDLLRIFSEQVMENEGAGRILLFNSLLFVRPGRVEG